MSTPLVQHHLQREFVTIYFLQGSKQKVTVNRFSLAVALFVFAFFCLGFRVWQEMQVVKLGYEINQLRLEQRRANAEHQILLSERNALAGLERIAVMARLQFGLITPPEGRLIFLKEPADFYEHTPWIDQLRAWMVSLLAQLPFSRVSE